MKSLARLSFFTNIKQNSAKTLKVYLMRIEKAYRFSFGKQPTSGTCWRKKSACEKRENMPCLASPRTVKPSRFAWAFMPTSTRSSRPEAAATAGWETVSQKRIIADSATH